MSYDFSRAKRHARKWHMTNTHGFNNVVREMKRRARRQRRQDGRRLLNAPESYVCKHFYINIWELI